MTEAIEKKEKEYCMNIILHPPRVINLDDDDMENIYDEVHNELSTLFTSYMILVDDSSSKNVEPGDNPSMALDVIHFYSFPPFACYTEQN